MQYTENTTGIKINIEAVDIPIGEDIKDTINKYISRLSRFYDKIEYAEIYLEDKKDKKTERKKVSIRLGVPGNDPFASEYGDHFTVLLGEVTNKLQRQLEKL